MVGDYYGDFLSPGTNTADDGSYELTSVDAGEIRARASSRANGKDSAKLSLAHGRIIEWNPVLTFGSRLFVRVIDERGEQLVDWVVEASATAIEGSPDFHASSATGPDGRCVINNCPARPMRVEVIDIKHFAMPQLVLDTVRVTGEEQVLRVRDESRLTSKFSGTLVDADDHPVKAKVAVTSLRRRRGLESWSDDRTGKFECGPFTADTYLVNATDDQGVNHRVGSYALPSNHDVDLGRIVLERAGRLQIAIRHVASIDVEAMRVMVRTDDPEGMTFGSDWDASRVPETIPVAPGNYFVDLIGSAIADARSRVVVRAGETTRVELEPIPGAFCSYRIVPEPNAALIAKAHLEFVDAHGVVVHSMDSDGEGRTELRGGYGLATGDYILRVTTDDGRRGEGQLCAGVGFMHGEALIRVR
jgi:hypothetical protein